MTTEELINILSKLPKKMKVMIPLDAMTGLDVCKANSRVEEVQFDEGRRLKVFVLQPCTCNTELLEDHKQMAEIYLANPDLSN